MNRLLIGLLALLIHCGCATASTTDGSVVEQKIGQLIISHDQMFSYENDDNPFGSTMLYDQFVKVFNSDIKLLSKDDQVRFLWSAMWHLDFDGHSMMQFQTIIAQNCGEEFIEKLEGYVKIENELQRNKSRLHLSEKVLFGIKKIMELGVK
ncbi:MAG: hypothetical protein ABW092_07540 [Candidatus Thiodiazotropha sp.]